MINRCSFFFLVWIGLGLSVFWPAHAVAENREAKVVWTDVKNLGLEGRGWSDTESYFDRLPARAKDKVRPPIWSLAHDSAGMLVRFVTDATNIQARWSLTSSNLAMPHMAATGVSGLDLYVRTSATKWHWLAVGFPKAISNSVELVKDAPPGKHEFMLYLPLYNGIKNLEIGVSAGASVTKAGPWGKGDRKPIVFYGTSILQGGCASRPGMAHCAILGRRFNWPTINLGFSGNGKMEPEMADLLAELDPAVYVLDCVPNMTTEQVVERVEPFVKRLRKAHPETPIVLVEDRTYGNAFFHPTVQKRQKESRAALKRAFEQLKKDGTRNLFYLPGEALLGDDGEATVDGSHPTDLGFVRQAEVTAKVLKPLLR
jgi:hypothetical protein